MKCRRRRALGLRGLASFDGGRAVRQHGSPHEILPRDLEPALLAEIRRLAGVTAKIDAVRRAPFRQLLVVGLLGPLSDRAVVVVLDTTGVRFGVVPERVERRRDVTAEQPMHVPEDPRRPRPHADFAAAAEEARFVGEDSGDGGTEVLAELAEVALVDQLDEGTNGRRVEDVGGGRFVLREVRPPVSRTMPPRRGSGVRG